jgi:preprotein translocase subunit SecA
MRPLYEALGLTVGFIVHELTVEERRHIYQCDVVYCANKELVFDYLKDRLLGAGSPRLATRWRRRVVDPAPANLMLRGLHYAIVDEADSVLVDEARTPLVISGSESLSEAEADMLRQGFEVAHSLRETEHFLIRNERIRLTPVGENALAMRMQPLGGLWRNTEYRESIVTQALAAQHRLERDRDYVVDEENQVQIVDPYTGRIMPGRSWGLGLHQMVELKEGVDMTCPRETMAEISYQNFFRKYCHLSGMTGTAVEVRSELRDVYALQCEVVPPRKPPRRRHRGVYVAASAREKVEHIVEAARVIHASGQPLLVGTATVASSERISRAFLEAGLVHRVLNARQDQAEAEVIAQAGKVGALTIATSMAGRGTDIKPDPQALQLGGLHVMITELQGSARVDRQLEGRSARQGDPGSISYIVSRDDALLARQRSRVVRGGGSLARAFGQRSAFAYLRYQQRRIARQHYKQRMRMVKADTARQRSLSFTAQ